MKCAECQKDIGSPSEDLAETLFCSPECGMKCGYKELLVERFDAMEKAVGDARMMFTSEVTPLRFVEAVGEDRVAALHLEMRQVAWCLFGQLPKCESVLFHGNGHQTRTMCEVRGPHEIHETVYGRYDSYARWRGGEAITGPFDEPPEDPEGEE